MGRPPDPDDEPERRGARHDDPFRVATGVAGEIEHARGEVFRAYIRARERARELDETRRPEDHEE